MKAKRVGKKDANTKTTQRCVIEEENEVLSVKLLCCTPSGNRSTRQLVGIRKLARDPQSLIYLMYLSPPNSYTYKATRNRVLFSSPNPATSSMLHLPSWLFPILSSNTKSSLNTLKGCGKCLGYQPLNGMELER